MNVELYRRFKNWQQATTELLEYKREVFTPPCVVYVDSGRFRGMGIVPHRSGDEGPGQLAVYLENGNIWCYSVDECTRIEESSLWPKWIQHKMPTFTDTK